MAPTTEAHPESTRGQLGQGIYSLPELRTYVAFYGTPKDGSRTLDWLSGVLLPVGHRSRRPDYSFSDLISLFVVRELIALGVAPFRIREAEDYMRRLLGTDRPFVHQDVATDGNVVWLDTEIPSQVERASHGPGQHAHRDIIGPSLRRVEYVDRAAAWWSPVPGVVLDPTVQFGEPVVAGTRILTSIVAEAAERYAPHEAAVRLGIKPQAARSALEFERRLRALKP
jgi:uncharacterized protein (DUF433 family)